MKVSVIGTGYVGLVTAVSLSYLGHDLTCLDISEERINALKAGEVPIYEPGLEELIQAAKENGNSPSFTTNAEEAIKDAEVIFIAVGTPSRTDGSADLSYLQSAAETIGEFLKDGAIVINKSTVPVGSGNWVEMLVEKGLKKRLAQEAAVGASTEKSSVRDAIKESIGASNAAIHFTVASNPEFLREGSAIHDTLYPDRIVIGADNPATIDKLKTLYKDLAEQSFKEPSFCKRPEAFKEVPVIATDITSAEMIKYSANCFLSMKISFANQIANICDLVGADVNEVMHGIGTDSRIGEKFLNAGIGWGGSCFGKDLKALINIAREYGYDPELLTATEIVNYRQRELVIKRLQEQLKIIKGKKIGLLGLAFKPNTDDLRDAPALDIARSLLKLGAHVVAADPQAIDNCKKQFPELEIEYAASTEELAKGLDALVLVTEWDEYKKLSMKDLLVLMKGNLFIDARNQYDPKELKEVGFNYVGIGRA